LQAIGIFKTQWKATLGEKLKFDRIILFVFSFLVLSHISASENIINIPDTLNKINITPKLSYFEDTQRSYGINEIVSQKKWTASSKKILRFGETTSAFWLKFSLISPSKKNIILQMAPGSLDKVTIYKKNGPLDSKVKFQTIRTGGDLPYSSRPLKHNDYAFPFEIIGETYFFIRIESQRRSVSGISIKVFSTLIFQNLTFKEYLLLGFYFGILLVMFLYNIFIFFSTRSIDYLYYVLFILFLFLYHYQ